jgi:hypothetical protein
MKLQLESYGKKYIVETQNDDLDIFEYFEIFSGMLIQAGFSPSTIQDANFELSEQLKDIS